MAEQRRRNSKRRRSTSKKRGKAAGAAAKVTKVQVRRARECGWRSSTPQALMRIPHYDAIDDKYCSITDSRVFRSVQSKLRRGKYKGKLDMSKSLFNQIRRQRAQQLVEPPAMPARGITAMAAAHNAGAFSFASADFQIESRGRDERTKR